MILPDLFRYTQWANERILGALRDVGDTAQDPETELPDAQRLLSHLLRAQAIWLGRVQDTGDANLDLWTLDSLTDCARRSQKTVNGWLALVQDPKALKKPITYSNSSGTSFTNDLSVIAHHVVNHGTHHRAQIARMLREAGHTPPATDYIFFARK